MTKPHYEYKYDIYAKDNYEADLKYGQDEVREGYDTHGAYEVLLPDGRVQRVQYSVSCSSL